MRTITAIRIQLKTALLILMLPLVMTDAYADQEQLRTALESAQIPVLNQPQPALLTSGQPPKEAFAVLANKGVKHVINLRPEAELGWDEQALVESLGMTYHALPVSGASGITPENAHKLRTLLASLNSEPALLHCSSSNRVGGLKSLLAFEENGGNIEAAIQAGKAWGLSGLEETVRKVLENKQLAH